MNNYGDKTKIFKAFCDERRLLILELLKSGEMCACELLEKLNIGQSTLSHHMKILCDSGVVISRKEGKWAHYSISCEGVKNAKNMIDILTTSNAEFLNKSNTVCK
ncbi:ArsR/SmtB family transcription factor [Clostridium tarantellae]|uniref:Metalloregulator ArsR/SmtB family transcription factor n=1 Tax=Clostridium tarantellae TaxID=39493 RepID=A0A6I1MRA3_9CLOT|nr:metalloregulator ArsR/SmtB family transcription factor [Clostridium tarantellae]MPQ44998.1 metalloregulator ArsR/SmtB family transcription factor [Clostridium tarantellae]